MRTVRRAEELVLLMTTPVSSLVENRPPLPPRKRTRGKMAAVKHDYPSEVWCFLRIVVQIARRIEEE